MKYVSAIVILGMMFGSCTTNIYIARHAERLNNSANTPLSEDGKKRAFALSELLKDKQIDLIYSTVYDRTKSTAEPLSKSAGIPIGIYEPSAAFSEGLKKLKNKNVLVVGHSNTVPETIKDITGKSVLVADGDFDNLYHIRIRKFLNTKVTLVSRTYGALSP